MKVRSQVILQKQRAIKATVWLVLDKAVNEGFEGIVIAECPNEKEANRIASQAARIAELEAALRDMISLASQMGEDDGWYYERHNGIKREEDARALLKKEKS